jgi:hypothetical protein
MAAMVSSTIAFHLHLQSNGGNGHSDHNVAHHGQCEPSSKLILAGKCQLKRPLLTQTGEKVFPTNARKKNRFSTKLVLRKISSHAVLESNGTRLCFASQVSAHFQKQTAPQKTEQLKPIEYIIWFVTQSPSSLTG